MTGCQILITGGSGLVGSLMAVKAANQGIRVHTLVRGSSNEDANRRFRHAVRVWIDDNDQLQHILSHVNVIKGDVTEINLGLSPTDWRYCIENTDIIIHTAASVKFDQAAEAQKVNIEGSWRVAELALAARSRIVYVSTAYVTDKSKRRDQREALCFSGSLRNSYESSKAQAEQDFWNIGIRFRIPVSIVRPSILMGRSADGRTIRFNNMYAFMRVMEAMSKSPRMKSTALRLPADPAASLNLVPVDYAVDAIWHIAIGASSTSRIYHITNPVPPTLRDLAEWLYEIYGVRILLDGDQASVGESEIFPNQLHQYSEYLRGEPSFDRTNTLRVKQNYDFNFPPIHFNYFNRLAQFAAMSNWGRAGEGRDFPAGAAAQSDLPVVKMDFGDKYFGTFLSNYIGMQLIKNLRSLTAVFCIYLTDVKQRWFVAIRDGHLTDVGQNSCASQCEYQMDSQSFLSIVSGEDSPQQAFFNRRIDIAGDIETGLRVATALAEFFRQYPYSMPKSA